MEQIATKPKRKRGKSPTARSLEVLRREGYVAEVVEQKIRASFGTFTRDLFNVIDIIAIEAGYVPQGWTGRRGILAIQATGGTGGNHAARRAKSLAEPLLRVWLQTGARFEIWSWAKQGARGKRKTWTLRREPITLADLSAVASPVPQQPTTETEETPVRIHKCDCGGEMLPWNARRVYRDAEDKVELRCVSCGATKPLPAPQQPADAGELEQEVDRVRDIATNHTLAGIRMLARDWLKLVAERDAAQRELAAARQDCGALWTLISQISEPIGKCFGARTMPFAEFQKAALNWATSIAGKRHPDTLRAQRDKLQAFKDYVHKRLDDAGVPVDPESPHKAEGCRVGGRLDWVLVRCAVLGKFHDDMTKLLVAAEGDDLLQVVRDITAQRDAARMQLAEMRCSIEKAMNGWAIHTELRNAILAASQPKQQEAQHGNE